MGIILIGTSAVALFSFFSFSLLSEVLLGNVLPRVLPLLRWSPRSAKRRFGVLANGFIPAPFLL